MKGEYKQLSLNEHEISKLEKDWLESFNSLEDVMILIDKDFNIEKINTSGLKFVGKTEKEIIGKKCYEALHNRDAPVSNCPLKKSLRTERVESIDHFEKDSDRYFSIKASPIFGEDGRIVKFVDLMRDITVRKKAKKVLEESEAKLRAQKLALEQKNIALREILEEIEIEKKQIKDYVAANVDNLVLPILDKLKLKGVSPKYISLLQRNLEELTSTFSSRITEKKTNLSPREIEICNMIRNGFASKEISSLLNISCQTVEKHRKNIRNKFGISNKKINLISFLQGL